MPKWHKDVAALVAVPFSEVEIDRLLELHGAVFSSDICRTCTNQHIAAYIDLYRLIHPKKDPMANSSKYTFEPKRRDVSIRVPHKGWTITVDTLTDEQAEWMLARGTWPDLLVLKSEAADEKPKKRRGRPSKAVAEAETPAPVAADK